MDLEKAFVRVPREVLYTEACTVVRTDAGLSESYQVKVGLHQGSVLSPLLFAVVTSSEARSDPPTELLSADDLVLLVLVWLNGELVFLKKD